MKKVIVPFLLGALFTLACVFTPNTKLSHSAAITPERKATHMITYYDAYDPDKAVGVCTGTSVGPNALLTALHCDRGESAVISLDLSVRKYHIIGTIYDGRDHIIYHLDGPAFKNVVTIHEREAVLGEIVTSYGDGQEEFPQHIYFGKAVVDVNGGDTSEVDAADATHCFSLPVVPGDSGSAIYGTDGSIVALVTYGGRNTDGALTAVGFALAFTPQEIEEIKE